MGVRERDEAVDSPLYVRGELDQPGEVVPRGLVRVLCDETPAPIAAGSGRRELADWLASPANPLTARVIVNRVWLHLFGRGLVPTPDNFGAAGQPPSHPELLDTLAVDFMADGWSIKRLIRRIVLSRAYGLDSAHDPHNFEADPDNALVWRMSKRRLEAEALRDALLFVSGRLAPEPPVGSAVARTGEGLALFVRVAGLDASDTHRSVYLPVVRDQVLESLALFDFADPSLVTGERATTTGPAQALYFMNGPFVIRQAEALAERVRAVEGDDARRVERAYRLAFARPPTAEERDRALAFLRDFAARTERPTRRERLVGVLPGALRRRRVPIPGLITSRSTEQRTDPMNPHDLLASRPAEERLLRVRLPGLRRPVVDGGRGRTRRTRRSRRRPRISRPAPGT